MVVQWEEEGEGEGEGEAGQMVDLQIWKQC